MKKNILVLNYEFPPLGWGQANANYYLFKEFSKYKNFNFTLITSSSNKYKEEQFSNNIKIYYLDIWKNWENLHSQSIKNLLSNAFKTYKLFKKLINNQKFDSLMCWSYPAIWLGYFIKKFYNIPYIVLLRGSDVPFHQKKWKNLDKFIFKYLAPIFWKNSKIVIANSKRLKNWALKINKKQDIKIIPNWVDTNSFSYDKSKKIKDKFIILWVWRLSEIKNFYLLLNAISKIKKNKNIEIWLVWDWPEKEKLKVLAKKYKIFLKLFWLINQEKLKELYKQANIFCLPSKNEWMSNTLLEAIASWLPVVVTDVWWSKELVKWNWFIVNIWDKNALKEKIEILLNNKEKRIEFEKKSIELSKDLWWKKVGKIFIKYLK